MKKQIVFILFCSLFLIGCDNADMLTYIDSGKYISVYQYKSEEYFDYITSNEVPNKIDYIYPTYSPVIDSNELLWSTRDAGKYGKNLPYLLNEAAFDSLSFCDFLQKEIYRLENNCFIYANKFLSQMDRSEEDYFKIYNIKRTDYCNGYDKDTLRCIEESPYSAIFKIPCKDITNGIGKNAPTFRELVEYINRCINDSSISDYEAKEYKDN